MLGALWVGSGTQILLEHLPRSPPPLPLQGPASQICLELSFLLLESMSTLWIEPWVGVGDPNLDSASAFGHGVRLGMTPTHQAPMRVWRGSLDGLSEQWVPVSGMA